MKYKYFRFVIAASVVCGCHSDLGVTPIGFSTASYWELRLNHHAIQLSLRPPYNTVQLDAVPYSATGELWSANTEHQTQADSILMESPSVYLSRDSTKVLVSSTGLITARAVQSGTVFVVATRKIGSTVHWDSVLVRVADVAVIPVLDTFRVRPRDGDSAKIAIPIFGTGIKSFTVTTKNSGGAAITNLPVHFTSSDALVARVDNAFAPAKRITPIRPGSVILRASAWIYGVVKHDSFPFTVGYPINSGIFGNPVINPGGALSNTQWEFGPGATVIWDNITGVLASEASRRGYVAQNGVSVDIVFDDSLNVLPIVGGTEGGNIRGISGDTTIANGRASRRFLLPGTYTYRALPFNTIGKVVIHDK